MVASSFKKALGVLIVIVLVLTLGPFLINVSNTTTMVLATQKEFEGKNERLLPLVTTIMDRAENENVRSEIDTYADVLGYEGELEGRRPIYFVREKNGQLQKLFQGGDIKNEVVDNELEEYVVRVLKGSAKSVNFPQYTCCGGDDPWKDSPILGPLLPDRRYLKDFPSEIEIISPIKDKSGTIWGAAIILYGD